MGDIDHAQMLILMARKDLKALLGMINGEPFDDEVFGLHLQQAAGLGIGGQQEPPQRR